MQFFYYFKQQVGNIADAVFAISGDTANVDIGEVVVGAAFASRDTYLGWCRVVVDLDQKQQSSSLACSRVRLPAAISAS